MNDGHIKIGYRFADRQNILIAWSAPAVPILDDQMVLVFALQIKGAHRIADVCVKCVHPRSVIIELPDTHTFVVIERNVRIRLPADPLGINLDAILARPVFRDVDFKPVCVARFVKTPADDGREG